MLDTESIGTGLAILGTAEVSKDAIQRILAPTADYVGAGLLRGTKGTVNSVRVLAKAVKRLGPRLRDEGQIPPRVMLETLDQAFFCDDELTAEYLGGVLASSYSEVARDDRGLALLSTLRRLSTYALRTHYICYRAFWHLFTDMLTLTEVFPEVGLSNSRVAEDTRVLANKKGYSMAMELSDVEDYDDIYMHVSRALAREDLLKLGPMGDEAFLTQSLRARSERSEAYSIEDSGFIYDSTIAGGELFLWGLGQGGSRLPVDLLLATGDVELDVTLQGFPDTGGFQRLSDLGRFR